MAEGKLAEALDAARIAYTLDPGGGAFYAPKIDVFIEDALGRQWQMATIQLDYQLPQQFELEYRSADGGVERPVVIHYAIYGSFERFIGILVEHYAGAFPLWLAPVQAVIVPIADRHLPPAEELASVLRARGLRVDVEFFRQPDAEQDPAGPGAEDPVHAGPRRPRGRGPDGRAPDPLRRAAAGAGLGGAGRPPGRGVGRPRAVAQGCPQSGAGGPGGIPR